MGARSFIVRGLGNRRELRELQPRRGPRDVAYRGAASASPSPTTWRRPAGVECRKDKDVIDETPAAYKDIDAVMAAQRDLVEIAYTLKQVLCVKG